MEKKKHISKFEFLNYFIHTANTYVINHKHQAYELVYYIEGKGFCATEKEKFEYSPLSYVIIPPNTVHNETHDAVTSVVCVTFYLSDGFVLETGLFHDKSKRIYDIIAGIKNEYYEKLPDFDVMIEAMTDELLINIHRQQYDKTQSMTQILDMRKYINESYQQDISVKDIANNSGYSYDYFRHLFKEQTGISPKKYLTEKRIEHAKMLLSTSSLYITDVCTYSGFSDICEFSILFKKYTGLSPTEYRKSVSKIKK